MLHSGHTLNAASVFAGLQYFNVLRQPIAFLPMAFTAVSDAAVAIGRIGEALRVSYWRVFDELRVTDTPYRPKSSAKEITIEPTAKLAIDAKGSFQFDSVLPPSSGGAGGFMGGRKSGPGQVSTRRMPKRPKRLPKSERRRAFPKKSRSPPSRMVFRSHCGISVCKFHEVRLLNSISGVELTPPLQARWYVLLGEWAQGKRRCCLDLSTKCGKPRAMLFLAVQWDMVRRPP